MLLNPIKNNHVIILLLLAAITLMPYMGQWTHTINNTQTNIVKTTIATPCPHSKAAQEQSTRNCQSQNGNTQLHSILPDFLVFFCSLSGKIYFIFLLSLFSSSQLHRIYKPPRTITL